MLPISRYLSPDALDAAGFVRSAQAGVFRNGQTWSKGSLWVDLEGGYSRDADGQRYFDPAGTAVVWSYYIGGAPWAGGQRVFRLGDLGAGASFYAAVSFEVPDLGAVVSKLDFERIVNERRGDRGFVTGLLNAGNGLGAVLLVAGAFAAFTAPAVLAAAPAAEAGAGAAVVTEGVGAVGAGAAAIDPALAAYGAELGAAYGEVTVAEWAAAMGVSPAVVASLPLATLASTASTVAKAGAAVAGAAGAVRGGGGGGGGGRVVGGGDHGVVPVVGNPLPVDALLASGLGVVLALGLIWWGLKG